MYKQIIIVRKDLNMTPGKMAAQVSHASMVFLTNYIRNNSKKIKTIFFDDECEWYETTFALDKDLYEQWIDGIFTKVILGAKNKNQLLEAKALAEEIGFKENKDFFLIKDCCNTEIEPEEVDENGVGRTVTCIGFVPMEDKIINQIGKKYQLYK